ncbi:hypothetical protein EJB05_55132, partial [Eragrostis curvula]
MWRRFRSRNHGNELLRRPPSPRATSLSLSSSCVRRAAGTARHGEVTTGEASVEVVSHGVVGWRVDGEQGVDLQIRFSLYLSCADGEQDDDVKGPGELTAARPGEPASRGLLHQPRGVMELVGADMRCPPAQQPDLRHSGKEIINCPRVVFEERPGKKYQARSSCSSPACS